MKFDNYGRGIAKGMWVTIQHLLPIFRDSSGRPRRPTVTQYPEQRLNTSRRIRGNELIWSREKCTGCATCAKSCHEGAIEIVTAANLVNNKYEVLKYEVDTGYCIMCGICVEACPFNALYMGTTYEAAKYRRDELIQQKEDMLYEAGLKTPSGYYYPDFAAALPMQTLLIEKIVEPKAETQNTEAEKK